jgi:hypothetical protein
VSINSPRTASKKPAIAGFFYAHRHSLTSRFRNRTDQTVDISGWYLSDKQQNRIDLPQDTSIRANEHLQVLSGSGTDATSPNYVRTTNALIWNNAGDTARLYDGDGELVTEFSY